MDIIVGILDAFLTCVIISKIYSRICEISKKERYIFGFIFFVFQVIYAFIFSFIDSDKLILILHYTLKNFYPILFYCYFKFFKKYDSSKNIFLSLIFSLLYQSAHTFLSVTISSITGDLLVEQHERLFFFIINLISYFVIDKIITYFNLELKYFDKDYLYPFFKKVIVAFFTLHIVLFISDIVSTFPHLNSFGSILAAIIFICLLLCFFAMNSYKVQIEKEIALKQKKFEQKYLQTYTDEIVGLYNEIRGFRHDYAGMLVSMQMAIDSEDLQEIDRVYNEVLVKANQKLRSEKYTYFDLNNIEDSALRSLIAQSIVYARNNDVEFTLEVKDVITRLSIDLLDLVRIMSILLNNAVEGAVDSYLKQMEVAVIKMDFETVIVIQNSCKITMTPSENLFALGFSTKGRNRGLGLNNVNEILDKYDNIILETEMEDNTFRQIIRFKREFE
ncbi:competence system sensor histidine kinase ComD [Streptococcus oralis]|uniref:Histidine kinase of the competence regulon ComD n=2 Tax=Streptococcus TaxID=1301 RepID=A0A139QRU4_STROR|nr:competence system sensor histidine kinase ComD [Streptococcus oralis]KXU05235.1 Histidine kinase of the competence regulon ComD [Streptococcus oralis]